MAKNKRRKKRSKIMPIVLGAVLIIGVIFGINEYIYYSNHGDTDDAQINGDISPITTRVGGYIKLINFKDNQVVQKGDLLFVLDSSDYKIRVAESEAALNTAKANLNVAKTSIQDIKANIGSVQANLDAAKANYKKAKEDLKRFNNLFKKQAVTQEQLDGKKVEETAAKSKVRALESQLSAINTKIKTAKIKIEAAKSNIPTQQAALDMAQQQLSYTNIYAPFTGKVSKRNVQVGQFVNPGQNLVALVSSTNIYIIANYKETELSKIKIGAKVNIKVDAFPDLELKGHVESFSGATGAKFSLLPASNATGNYVKVVQRIPVRIEIDANDSILKKLAPGFSVETSVLIK